MHWTIQPGDILDQPADILVCSANPYLTLSGGVGGALLKRYGDKMQAELATYLQSRGIRHVPRETIVKCAPHGSPYLAVLHAVTVDAAYQSSPEIIHRVVTACLQQAASLHAKTIALTALATGYGHLTFPQFAAGIHPLRHQSFGPLQSISIVVRHPHEAEEITQHFIT